MKIGTLCKVTAKKSHNPSQFGHLIVVIGNRGLIVVAHHLKTGKTHHYFTKEIEEVIK